MKVVGVAGDVSLFKSSDIETGRSCAAGMSLAGAHLLARWCPAWRRREPDLRPSQETWEGGPEGTGRVRAVPRERSKQAEPVRA